MMPQAKHTGIVLRQYQNQYKIALIDHAYGRVDAVTFNPAISAGSLVEYGFRQQSNSVLFIENMEIIALPVSLAQHDILFLHHVLEVCFYFIPIHSCVNGIFELLQFLYTVDTMMYSMQWKKMYLLKLLALIGFYPELPSAHRSSIEAWIKLPLNEALQIIFTSEQEQALDRWFYHCIAQHPQVGSFNTIKFLKNRPNNE